MIRESATAACFLAATLVSSAGAAQPDDDVADAVNLEFKAMPIITSEAPHPEVPEDDVAPPMSAAAPFGQAGSWRWNVQLGFGEDLQDTENRFGLGGLSFSYFATDDFSVEIEFNGLYFDQETIDNAGGFNFNLLLRWHVLARDDWSLFVDLGGGVMETSDAVPAGGSSFNFIAQAGGGFSFDISDEVRLFTGLRLHHISNSRTFDSNPGQDSFYVYAGLSFPF